MRAGHRRSGPGTSSWIRAIMPRDTEIAYATALVGNFSHTNHSIPVRSPPVDGTNEGLHETTELTWRKSAKSYSDGHCVEVASTDQARTDTGLEGRDRSKAEIRRGSMVLLCQRDEGGPVGYKL